MHNRQGFSDSQWHTSQLARICTLKRHSCLKQGVISTYFTTVRLGKRLDVYCEFCFVYCRLHLKLCSVPAVVRLLMLILEFVATVERMFISVTNAGLFISTVGLLSLFLIPFLSLIKYCFKRDRQCFI